MNPRRSVKSTVPSTSTPPRRRSLSVRFEHLGDDRLGDEAREDVAHLLALERGQDDVHAERADRRERERGERVDERDDPAVVERELHCDGERSPATSDRGRSARSATWLPSETPGTSSDEEHDQDDRQRGRRCSGAAAPRRTVAIAFAWISPPGISGSTGVWWMSCSDGAARADHDDLVPVNAPFGTLAAAARSSTSSVVKRPGRAGVVDPRAAVPNGPCSTGRPVAVSTVTTASVFRPLTAYGTFRITPAESVGKRPLAGLRADLAQRLVAAEDPRLRRSAASPSSPARRCLRSRPSRAARCRRASSVCSVNWMSTAIALRVARSDPVDHLRVVAGAGTGHRLAEVVRRHVVDRDEHDVCFGGVAVAADREARVDRLALERVQHPEAPEDEDEPGGAQRRRAGRAGRAAGGSGARSSGRETIPPWRREERPSRHASGARPAASRRSPRSIAPQLDFLYRAAENFERAVQFADAKAGGVC